MKKFTIFFGIFAFVILGIWLYVQVNLSPVNPSNKTLHVFVVQPGSGLRQVANDLSSQGLIKNTFVFLVYMKTSGLDSKIQKGDFTLTPSFSSEQIAKTLTSPTLDIWTTIIPGQRADEIADILKEKIPSYSEEWRAQLRLHEGYLFPDTYLIPRDTTITQIISIMTNNFNSKYQQATSGANANLSQLQAVILASILQREAPGGDDMRKVASVLQNRLSLGMALQVDATVQYALGYQPREKSWWKKNLTAQDLNIDSPYNTYAQPGLPPTPISNPGLEALKAVLNPANTNYIYYISDSKGVMHYATTLDQHNANIRRYGL